MVFQNSARQMLHFWWGNMGNIDPQSPRFWSTSPHLGSSTRFFEAGTAIDAVAFWVATFPKGCLAKVVLKSFWLRTWKSTHQRYQTFLQQHQVHQDHEASELIKVIGSLLNWCRGSSLLGTVLTSSHSALGLSPFLPCLLRWFLRCCPLLLQPPWSWLYYTPTTITRTWRKNRLRLTKRRCQVSAPPTPSTSTSAVILALSRPMPT